MDIKDVNDFNLWTKELGYNYWSTYTKSGIGEVQVTSLHYDPIGVDILQMATYWFVIGWLDIQKAQKSKV